MCTQTHLQNQASNISIVSCQTACPPRQSYDSTRMFGWIEYGDKEIFMNIYELRQDDAELYLNSGLLGAEMCPPPHRDSYG